MQRVLLSDSLHVLQAYYAREIYDEQEEHCTLKSQSEIGIDY